MKLWTYTVILTGLIIFLELLGIPTGTATLLNFVGVSLENGFQVSNALRTLIFVTIIGLATAAGIKVGLLPSAQPENYVILPLLISFGIYYIHVLINIIQYAYIGGSSWSAYVVLMILAPLEIGWFVSVVEFFRGTD